MHKKIEKEYRLYAFVAPNGAVNRMFTSEQSDTVKPDIVTQVQLTIEQHDKVLEIRQQGKRTALIDGSIVEFTED
jgi:hypothetical protein